LSRKIFKHSLVEPFTLSQQTIDGKRFYVLPEGIKLKSVTTVLSEKTDKTALFEWRKRVGNEEANKISVQAGRRGTSVHGIAERYVLNEENYYKKEVPANIDSFKKIKPIIDKNVDNIYGIELALFSKTLKAAGKTDLVAHYNGVPSIIDFKTSLKLKKEEWIENYFLQSTTYSMMFESLYKIQIPQIVIIIAVDHESPQVFVKERKQYVNKVIEIFTT
jgi:genome maintenance exonuclease 1